MPLSADRNFSTLTLRRRSIASVFDLLGRAEVDLTSAVGWTLAASPAFLGHYSMSWAWVSGLAMCRSTLSRQMRTAGPTSN